jgi:hypothetical protein
MIADLVDRMQAAGLPRETIAIAVRIVEEAQQAALAKAEEAENRKNEARRAKNAERQRNHRARNAMSRDVTHVTRDRRDVTVTPPSPRPPEENPPAPPLRNNPLNPQPPERARGALAAAPWPPDYGEQFWKAFPNKVGKRYALRQLERVVKSGEVEFDEFMAALHRYAAKTDDRPFCNPSTWINQGRWLDEPAAQANGNKPHNGRGGLEEATRRAIDMSG